MIDLLVGNWPTVVGLTLVGALTYWGVDEYDSGSSPSETIEGVGKRADNATGEFLGVIGSIVFTVTMIVITVGQQLAETAGMLEPLLSQAPVVIGHIVIAVLGYLALDGTLGWAAQDYGYAVVLVTVIALFIRYGRD